MAEKIDFEACKFKKKKTEKMASEVCTYFALIFFNFLNISRAPSPLSINIEILAPQTSNKNVYFSLKK